MNSSASIPLRHQLRLLLVPTVMALSACAVTPEIEVGPVGDIEVQDLTRVPQRLEELPAISSGKIELSDSCQKASLAESRRHFFSPWTSAAPLFDTTEAKDFMKKEARAKWYGVNKRRVPRKLLQTVLDNCDLNTFPSRNDKGIAVAPAHLRGLPTPLPLYEKRDGAPFDMLSYPHVKLNEPLRILHSSRDGAWLFVETSYTNGWLESRDVALVDPGLIDLWMELPQLVVISDETPVPDGRDAATFRTKTGTILPLVDKGEDWWEVKVASAGEGGMAEWRSSRIRRAAAAQFPLDFTGENISLVGNPLLGQPYGWGEVYDLRDCSALLRDLFLPFGIWLPRTSLDQIEATEPVKLEGLRASEKEGLIKSKGVPFRTLLYKPGHIMLYAGLDRDGRPLVFHDSWSIRLLDEEEARTEIIGMVAVTTLKPGEELGLVAGSSLLDKLTQMGTVPKGCE